MLERDVALRQAGELRGFPELAARDPPLPPRARQGVAQHPTVIQAPAPGWELRLGIPPPVGGGQVALGHDVVVRPLWSIAARKACACDYTTRTRSHFTSARSAAPAGTRLRRARASVRGSSRSARAHSGKVCP